MLLAQVIPRGDTKALANAVIAAEKTRQPTSQSLRPALGAGVAAALHDPLQLYANRRVKGLGGGIAVHLEAVREAAARIAQTSESDAPILANWEAVGTFCRRKFAGQLNAAIAVLLLDYRHRLIAEPRMYSAGQAANEIAQQSIVAALRHAASGLIVIRLDPEGNLTDRRSDHDLARSVRDAGAPVSVLMHDYIIVADDNFMSLRSMGVLEVAPLYDAGDSQANDHYGGWYAVNGETLAALQDRVVAGEVARLRDPELMALLLRRAVDDDKRFALATRLLQRFANMGRVLAAPVDELVHELQAGAVRESSDRHEIGAIQLAVIGEAAQRYLRAHILHAPPLTNMPALMRYCRAALAYSEVEQLHALFLSKSRTLLWDEVVSRGTINAAPVQPREIASRALRLGARYVVLVHNHPTGDPSPSQADVSMTLRVDEACRVIGVKVLDHVIVAASGESSLYASGRMPRLLRDHHLRV